MKLVPEIIYCVKPKYKHMSWVDALKQYSESVREREYDMFVEFPINKRQIYNGLLVDSFFDGCDAKYTPQRDISEDVDWV